MSNGLPQQAPTRLFKFSGSRFLFSAEQRFGSWELSDLFVRNQSIDILLFTVPQCTTAPSSGSFPSTSEPPVRY